MKKKDEGILYELHENLKDFKLAFEQCKCGGELMVRINGNGQKRYYCPASGRFFGEGGSCKSGSLFAAPL